MNASSIAMILAIALVVVAVVTAMWCSWTAGRLDRLHVRCEGARSALEAALARRRALSLELAGSPGMDPASSVLLTDAATPVTSDGDSGERWQAESDLSIVIRAIAPDAPLSPTWDDLGSTAQRVALSRRIHNDLVATTLSLRSRRRVRWFRLAGGAKAPATVSFDDEPPAASTRGRAT